MAKTKIMCDFSAFEDVLEKIDKLGGNKLKEAVGEALQESYIYVTKQIIPDIEKHHLTGDTEKSLRKFEKVKWDGNEASIDVGFDIAKGGLPSIFLMYGTPKHAPKPNPNPKRKRKNKKNEHPGTTKDEELYNDIYGTQTKNHIKKIQNEIFEGFLKKNM